MDRKQVGPLLAREISPLDTPASGDHRDAGLPPFVPILLYHAVADEPRAGFEAYTVPRRTFSEHVRAIVWSGRTPLTISQVATCMRGEAEWPLDPVVIRFDDGYDDTQQSVQALLEEGLSATVYVTSGTVGSRHAISASAVTELAALAPRVEIGSHSIHHPFLDELSRPHAAEEIAGSRDMLEQITGKRVDSFAYPYGAFSRHVRQTVIEAGYLSAAAVKNALARADDDVFSIAAWTVSPRTTAARVTDVLDARNVSLSWRRERVRTMAFRWTRTLRRRVHPRGRR